MAAVNFDKTTDEMVKKIEDELKEIRVRDYRMGWKAGYHEAMLNVKKGLGEFLSGLEEP